MHKTIAFTFLAAALALSACGDTPLERGATGAAAGALGTAALGGNAAVGAAVGGAAGVISCNKNVYGKCK
jgi:osmotically inducible lipoprotein OsmB